VKRLTLLASACLSAAAQGPDLARDLIEKGYLSIQNGDAPGALALFEDAVHLDPADPLAAKQLGYLYLKANDRAAALDAFAGVLRLTPQDHQTALQRAFILQSLGRSGEAAQDYGGAVAGFRQALAAAPGRPEMEKELAYALLKTGATLEAREAFLRAVRLDPADERAAMELAFLQHETGEAAEALATF